MKHLFSLLKIKLILFLLSILLLVGCVNIFNLSDLRSDGLMDNYKESKAKLLLTEMGIAHGIKNWTSIKTYTVNFGEEFYGFIGQQDNPFKNENTSLSLSYIPNQPIGQLEILSGRERGYIWGFQDNQAYTIWDDELKKTVDKEVQFWVSNYQFIIEFPHRIQNATSLAYAGKDTINGIICEGIFASWKTIQPQNDIDQYVIWIDSETKMIAKVEYTKRKINKFSIEIAYFNNYNNYEGIILPYEILVESNLVKNGPLHKMSIFSFNRDLMHINSLRPLDYLEED